MSILSSPKVIIIDDDHNEALPVLRAFAKQGISSVYFDGTPEILPDEDTAKLFGVRLIYP